MAHYKSCGCTVQNDIIVMPCVKHSRPRDPDAVQAEIVAILSRTMTSLETEFTRMLLTERNTAFGLLRKYGNHIGECADVEDFDADCTCGWDEVLKSLEAK